MFRLIDRYLIREIVPYFLLGLLLLTAIIFAHDASRFSEMIVVASRNGLPMDALSRVMAALVPGILVFTLPISLLIGTLVGLGRLSGDSEIVALGSSGMSRLRILRPVLLLSVIIAAVMFYICFNVLPRSIENLTDLKANQSLIFQGLKNEVKPRVFEESIPQKVLYIEEVDRAENIWRNIFLVDLGDDQDGMKIMTATSGSLGQGERPDVPELYLQDGVFHLAGANKSQEQGEPRGARRQDPEPASIREGIEEDEADEARSAAGSESTQRRERRRNRNQSSYTTEHFERTTIKLEFADEKKNGEGDRQQVRQLEEMEWSELTTHSPPAEQRLEWLAEIHKRVALPTTCLVFALLGVAFGISNVRTGRSFGLLLGLAITILYYLIALTGQHAAVTGKLPVWFGMWLANIALTLAGILVLAAQRRPGSDPLSILSRIRYRWPVKQADENSESATVISSPAEATPDATAPQMLAPESQPARRSLLRRALLPRLLDRLVLSDFARFFFFILGGFSALLIVITLFQLLDSIAHNRINWTVVANYLLFLLPMIVNYVTPLAALVAVMVTFGILQKTSQVVALKASGQSIFRLALPTLVAAVLLSGVVFLNQDYILPFTNRRQNNLRYLIRKGQEPPQTFYQTRNEWMFGQDSRIFNYAHFDLKTNSFYRLNVLDLSREPFTIKRRVYARRARWDDEQQKWLLEKGWERRFQGERTVGYEVFDKKYVEMAESPEYFKKDSRGSSSMTVAELQRKIEDLQQSGFDVLDLKIQLQSKIAFPLTCLVMVLVGLPFSFSVGKRGALYGVAMGIAIGLAYWGLIGLFEQMGRYEMLPPMLAAWGPNLLFGAGGLYLFLTSRT
jgi:LPS export ABC transporter permease LptG